MEILQEIGSYAGIAAILGLAVLSALYFSQARDVKRLREWAGRAPERGGVPAAAQPQPQQPRAVTAQPASQATRAPSRPVPGGTPPPVPRPPGAPTASAAAAAAGAGPAVARGPAPATPAAAQADDGAEPPAVDSRPDDGSRTPPSGDELDITKMDTVIHPPPSAEDSDGEDGAEQQGGDDLDATAIAPPAAAAAAAAARADHDAGADDEDDAYAEGYADGAPDDDGRDDDRGLDEEPDEGDDRTEGYGTGEFDTGEQGEWRPEDEHSGYPLTDEHDLAPLTPPAGTPRPPSPPPPYRRRGVQPATASGGDSGRILPPYEEARPGAVDEPAAASAGAAGAAGRRRALAIVGAGVAVAVIVFGALQLTGGSDEPTDEPTVGLSAGSEDGDADADGGGDGAAAEPVDPAQVTVAVLNGTTVPGLAATIGDRVDDEGFVVGTVTNNLDQERAESVVLYAPGAEAEAAEVGRRLGISQREQIDAESQALAGDATVVVVTGADQAQQ